MTRRALILTHRSSHRWPCGAGEPATRRDVVGMRRARRTHDAPPRARCSAWACRVMVHNVHGHTGDIPAEE